MKANKFLALALIFGIMVTGYAQERTKKVGVQQADGDKYRASGVNKPDGTKKRSVGVNKADGTKKKGICCKTRRWD